MPPEPIDQDDRPTLADVALCAVALLVLFTIIAAVAGWDFGPL